MWGETGFAWGWGMGFGMIGMVLFWGLIIFGIVALLRRLSGGSSTSKTALDILNERYARGDINLQEFEEKKRGIGK